MLPSRVSTTARALVAGVDAARARFVTYAEEHGHFSDIWAERIVAAHDKGYHVVGFPVENANPETMTSWAHLFDSFGPIVAPIEPGETNLICAPHASYRKELLLGYGDLLIEALENEAAFFPELLAKGKRFFMAGDALSSHVNISIPSAYLYTSYLAMRVFAASRRRLSNWSWGKRVFFIFGAPLIPWGRLKQILVNLKRTGRQVTLAPKILLLFIPSLAAGALGEMLGYAFGEGNCAQRMANVELQRERFVVQQDRGFKNARVALS